VSPPAWGVDSEHGTLLDVLLCPPDNFRWLATSAISRATLDAGHRFDAELAASQHADMVAAYEEAGVHVHMLDPDPALPYQVFARDSSAMTPRGAVITQLHQWWRRGEYAPAIRFYQQNEIPIRGMITAGALEGGDVVILEPGCAVIGAGEARTQEGAARQLAGWLTDDGWEVRVEPIPERFVHIDVLLAVLADRVAAVCAASCSGCASAASS
jgi:N-dimethylarginine dimethylaminohydrolase